MSVLQTMRRAALASIVVAAAAGATALPASASNSQCPTGAACIWGENDYTGCFYDRQVAGSIGNWESCSGGAITANNGANSAKNEGRSCDARFYDWSDRTGKYIQFNREISGTSYQDPYLANGGGLGGYNQENWQNRISSIGFVNCR